MTQCTDCVWRKTKRPAVWTRPMRLCSLSYSWFKHLRNKDLRPEKFSEPSLKDIMGYTRNSRSFGNASLLGHVLKVHVTSGRGIIRIIHTTLNSWAKYPHWSLSFIKRHSIILFYHNSSGFLKKKVVLLTIPHSETA